MKSGPLLKTCQLLHMLETQEKNIYPALKEADLHIKNIKN